MDSLWGKDSGGRGLGKAGLSAHLAPVGSRGQATQELEGTRGVGRDLAIGAGHAGLAEGE